MKKLISIIIAIAIILTISVYGYDSYYDIDVTISTMVKHADLKNQDLIYNFCYPNNYEEDGEFYVYNFYLNVDNNSKFDVCNIHMTSLFQHSDYEIHDDTSNSFDPFLVKSGENGTIALTICIKNNLTASEIDGIMHQLPKFITIDLIDPQEDNPVNYSKTIVLNYELEDKNYSNNDVQYPMFI